MTSLEALLTALARELRPLGRRARRRAFAELHDHLLSAVEEELARGTPRAEAEEHVAARFGDPAAIAGSLRAARPRRRRATKLAAAGMVAVAAAAATALVAGVRGSAPSRATGTVALASHPAGTPRPSQRTIARDLAELGVTAERYVTARGQRCIGMSIAKSGARLAWGCNDAGVQPSFVPLVASYKGAQLIAGAKDASVTSVQFQFGTRWISPESDAEGNFALARTAGQIADAGALAAVRFTDAGGPHTVRIALGIS